MKINLKDLLFPRESNDHHPHFWRMSGTIGFLSLIIFVEVIFFSTSYLVRHTEGFLASVFPSALVIFSNDVRTESDLPALKESSLLKKAAQLKADDMAKRGYFSHDTPEGNKPWMFLSLVGYDYEHAGENLAINFTDSKDVVDAWVNSPSHYANLVKQSYTEIGIATAQGTYEGRDTIFVVEFFGTPKKLSVNTSKPEITKQSPRPQSANRPLATSTIVRSTTTIVSSALPRVSGAEIDVREVSVSQNLSFDIIATMTRHIVALILSFIGLVVLLVFVVSLRRHNKIHHARMLGISFAFVVIILLSMLLNYFYSLGTI